MKVIKPEFNELLKNFAEHTDKAIENSVSVVLKDEFDKVAVVGFGINGVSGHLLKDYLSSKKEVIVVEDFVLPENFNSKTLVFILDFSGDSEDIVQLYRNALRKGCQIVCVSSGGKLETLCSKQSKTHIRIPYGIYDEESLPYFFFSMIVVLHNAKYIEDQNVFLNDVVKILKKDIFIQKGEELAKRMRGKIPLIYSTKKYYSVGYSWKNFINKFAGSHVFTNSLIDAEYSDAWAFNKLNGNYYVTIIRDNEEDLRVKKSVDSLKNKVKLAGVDIIEIGITGSCYLTKLLSAVLIGLWTSYYLNQKDILE